MSAKGWAHLMEHRCVNFLQTSSLPRRTCSCWMLSWSNTTLSRNKALSLPLKVFREEEVYNTCTYEIWIPTIRPLLTDAWPTKLIAYSSAASKIDRLIIVNLSCNQEMTILRSVICCLNGDWNFLEWNWFIRNTWHSQFVQHEEGLTMLRAG